MDPYTGNTLPVTGTTGTDVSNLCVAKARSLVVSKRSNKLDSPCPDILRRRPWFQTNTPLRRSTLKSIKLTSLRSHLERELHRRNVVCGGTCLLYFSSTVEYGIPPIMRDPMEGIALLSAPHCIFIADWELRHDRGGAT